jgi:arginine decarboxylase
MVNGDELMPKECFFTKGVGRHAQKLMSFELALRDAGIEKQNLVRVSSIYPTSCKIVPLKEGLPKLKPGQITFVVLAEAATDEPNRLICAGIGLAIPRNHAHGYIAEHHGYGMSEKKTEDLCEDLAATMLATTLGIPFDADKNWDEREQQYKMSGDIVKTRAVVQTAEGDKSGLWTSVISAVVFILDPTVVEKPVDKSLPEQRAASEQRGTVSEKVPAGSHNGGPPAPAHVG